MTIYYKFINKSLILWNDIDWDNEHPETEDYATYGQKILSNLLTFDSELEEDANNYGCWDNGEYLYRDAIGNELYITSHPRKAIYSNIWRIRICNGWRESLGVGNISPQHLNANDTNPDEEK